MIRKEVNLLINRSREDVIVDITALVVMSAMFILALYPFYYCLVISLNNGTDAARGGIYLWPRVFTLDNYKMVLTNENLMNGFKISTIRTVIGTLSSVFLTGLLSYVLAHRELMFRKVYMSLLIITMFFSGGLIPTFILLKNLGLYNSFLVYIVPGFISAFNVVVMMAFFSELPPSLEESAKLDGAGYLDIFFRIIVPVSTPIFATVSLFNAVSHWNNWFDSAFLVSSKQLRTMSYWLMDIINKANLSSFASNKDVTQSFANAMKSYTAESIRMATIIVVIIPIIMVYPFLQKYFVKGIMIGSVKG